MEKEKKLNALDGKNPFVRPSKGLPVAAVTKDTDEDVYIIERAMVDKVVKVGEGENDYIIKPELKEISRVNRQEYINSHREDVGILNIIKKVQLTGDVTLLNQRNVDIGYADITGMPTDMVDAMNAVSKGVADFDNLPEDIKGKMSLAQFAQQKDEDFNAIVNAVVSKLKESEKSQEITKKEGTD